MERSCQNQYNNHKTYEYKSFNEARLGTKQEQSDPCISKTQFMQMKDNQRGNLFKFQSIIIFCKAY